MAVLEGLGGVGQSLSLAKRGPRVQMAVLEGLGGVGQSLGTS